MPLAPAAKESSAEACTGIQTLAGCTPLPTPTVPAAPPAGVLPAHAAVDAATAETATAAALPSAAPTAPPPAVSTIATDYGTVPTLVSDSSSPKLAAGGSPTCPECPVNAGVGEPLVPPSPPLAPSLGDSGVSGVNPHIALVRTPTRLAFWAKQRADSLANSMAIISRCGAYCDEKRENYCHTYYDQKTGVKLQGWDSASTQSNVQAAIDMKGPLTLCSAIESSPEMKAANGYPAAASKYQHCGDASPWGNKTAAFIARRQFCAGQVKERGTGAGATLPALVPYLDLAYDSDNTAVLHEEKVRCGWSFSARSLCDRIDAASSSPSLSLPPSLYLLPAPPPADKGRRVLRARQAGRRAALRPHRCARARAEDARGTLLVLRGRCRPDGRLRPGRAEFGEAHRERCDGG